MGLDITAHPDAIYLPGAKPTDADDWYDNHATDQHTAHFAHAHEGIDAKPGQTLVWEFPERWDRPHVSARRSYSGYSAFRDRLAALSGVTDSALLKPGQPFFEMCWMSDCEGVFSTAACRRIADDFATWRDEYHRRNPDDAEGFDAWATVFRHAADTAGIVEYR